MSNVDFCIHGKEAFDLLQEQMEKGIEYKIIFTDFSMPIMNGIEATKHMREYLNERTSRE